MEQDSSHWTGMSMSTQFSCHIKSKKRISVVDYSLPVLCFVNERKWKNHKNKFAYDIVKFNGCEIWGFYSSLRGVYNGIEVSQRFHCHARWIKVKVIVV